MDPILILANLDWVWQTCRCGCSGEAGCPGVDSYFAFELLQNGNYVVEQPSWSVLPPECTPPSTATGDIECDVQFDVTVGDMLAVSWFEPSHQHSHEDATGTLVVDIFCVFPLS